MKRLLTTLGLIVSLANFAQPYSEIDKVIAADREEFDRFGEAVAITDTWAVVSAYGKGSYNNGQIYIYEKQGLNWVQTQTLQNSDNENYDRFGWSVAIDGDWIIVGAPREDDDENGNNNISKAGSAYIYKNIGGIWTEVQKIVANDRSADDEFGWSLDIEGNTIIVGAHQDFEDLNGMNPIHHAGSCYFFDLNLVSGIWSQSQKIVAGDRAPDINYPNGYSGEDLSDQFGHTVGISDDYVIVGALNHDFRPNGTQAWQCGSGYVFERSGGVWIQVQQIINSDNTGGIWERFGSDVAIDSNIIVCGSWSQDYTTNGTDYMKNAGAAYIFVRDNVGVWNENQKIDAGMRNSGDHFGWDVKINDGIIIAGTEHDDENENENTPLHEAGSAYIFEIDGAGMFNQIQKIVASDRDSLDVFGYAVDTYGVNVISGAFQHDWNLIQGDSLQEAGAAYIYSSVTCIPVYFSQSPIICNGQSFTEGTSTYTTAGTYNDYYTAVSGCDSIVTTNLTVNPTYDTTLIVSICDGDSYVTGISTYTTTGNYTDNLLTVNGCDSIVHTNLTVISPVIITQDITLCDGESITVGPSIYNSTGNYSDVLLSTITGCDSTVLTNLTVLAPVTSTQNITICDGDSFSVGTSIYATNGSYSDLLTAINGCDSTVSTVLVVVPLVIVNQNISICDGDSYSIGTSTYTTEGSFTDVLLSINGCDSVVNTEITILTEFIISQNITICYGHTYTIGTNTYTLPGNYTDTLEMVTSSCDSIVLTNLIVNLPIDLSLDVDENYIESNQNNSYYQWIDCDDNSDITNTVSNQQNIDVITTGNYAVIINNNNCIDTSACVYINYLGLSDYSTHNIKIYPNPSNGQFVVSTSLNQSYSIAIYNSVGQKLFAKKNVLTPKYIIDNINLSKGIYYVEVIYSDAKIIEKLIIE